MTGGKPESRRDGGVGSAGEQSCQAGCEDRGKELLAGGSTRLCVSHVPGAIRKMCGKAMWLDAGQVKMAGDMEEVMAAYER
mgnify:CR=1 FL=1